MFHSVNDIRLIALPHYSDNNGDLTVVEALKDIPFEVVRIFIVRADVNAIRGQHAHKACSQFLICPYGSVKVFCDDSQSTVAYILDHPGMGLLVPESIWAQQTYLKPNSVLSVLCNRPYETQDYIRDYQKFQNYRK